MREELFSRNMPDKDDDTPQRPSSFYDYIDGIGAIGAAVTFIALVTAAAAYRHRR